MFYDIIIKKVVLILFEVFILNCCIKKGKLFRIVKCECVLVKYNLVILIIVKLLLMGVF